MQSMKEAEQLARFAQALEGLDLSRTLICGYGHMGATASDAVLQAGLRYETVVAPRVRHILEYFPDAHTTSSFAELVKKRGAGDVLQWKHPEKLRRLEALLQFLAQRGLETETDLAAWLSESHRGELLRSLHGVGPKTVDYLRRLVGIPSVAVDRHICRFVAMAGIEADGYETIQGIVEQAANLLGIDYSSFDFAIWGLLAGSSRGHTPETIIGKAG